jgi:hypothetical protein
MTSPREFPAQKEQSVAEFSGGSNRGNGNDLHAPVGLWSGTTFRELIQFDHDWAGVYQIIKAELILTRTGEVHAEFGGSPRIEGRRVTEAWNRDGGAENSWSVSASTHWGNKPSTTATGKADLALAATSAEGTSKLDVTDIIEALAPASVLKRDGTPGGGNTNRGIELRSFDEGSTSRTTEFYSMRASAARRPYIKLTYSDNAPPTAPTITSPVGSSTPAIIGTTAGTEDTTSFLFNDPDAGDTCSKVEVEYYSAAATDEAPGTIVRSSGAVTPTGAGSLNAFTVKVTALPARTQMRKRLRTQDDKGAWGPWSPLADGLVQTAYRPRKPASPFMQSTPDRPHIFGTIDSGDAGDFVTGWEGEFYRDDTTGTVTLWAPGAQDIGGSPTRSDVEYSGTTLASGDVVRWRHRHINRDGVVGDWSEFYTTTMLQQTGPTTMTPSDTGTKLLSRTAQLTIGNATNFDGYHWRLYRGGALLADSGLQAVGSTASVNVNLPTSGGNPVAQWGDDLEWEAAIRPTGGSLESFSPRRAIYVNALPSTTLTASA